MRTLRKMMIWIAVYFLLTLGSRMAIQPCLWWMLPSCVFIGIGYWTIEYYARNYDKFK